MKRSGKAVWDHWMKLQRNAAFRRWLSGGVLLVVVTFTLGLILREREQLRQFENWHNYLFPCVQAFFVYPFSLMLQAFTWSLMIERLGRVPRAWRDVEIFAYTHLLRRLPGVVWYVAGRTAFYQGQGVGGGVAIAASSLEWLLLLLAAVAIYGSLSLGQQFGGPAGIAFLLVVVISSIWGLHALLRLPKPRWLPGPIRGAWDTLASMPAPRRSDLGLWLALYCLAYLMGGVILYLLVQSIAPNPAVGLLEAARIWALTAGIDFLVSMVIPASLGLREATITALLAPHVPILSGLLIAVLLRLIFLVGDLVWGGLFWSAARRAGRAARSSNQSLD